MARLTRKNIKVFAGNAANNGVFGSLQTGNPVTTTNVEQIQSLPAWNTGWNSATMTSEKLPPLEEFQGIQYVTTYQQAYLMQEGIPEWASTVTYYKGCLAKEVTSTGFRIYNSLSNNNTGNLLSDTSKWKKVMDSDDLYAFDSDVVHKAGAETITGAKTFENQLNVRMPSDAFGYRAQNTSVARGTTPANIVNYQWVAQGNDGLDINHRLGGMYVYYRTDGGINTDLVAYKPEAYNETTNPNINSIIRIAYPKTGSPYTYAPNPSLPSSASGYTGQIVTVGYLEGNSSGVVHKTGTETIDGAKTFNESPNFKKYILSQTTEVNSGITAQKTDVTKGTAPADNYNNRVILQSKDGTTVNQRLASLDLVYNTENVTSAVLSAFKPEFDSTTRAIIGVYYPATGNPYTYAPASDRDNSILTTVDSGTNWVELGNGWKIVRGRTKVTVSPSKTATTITFPTPFGFSSANSYSFAGTFETIDGTNTQYIDDTTFIVTEYKTNSVKGFGYDAGNNSYEAYMRWVAIGK